MEFSGKNRFPITVYTAVHYEKATILYETVLAIAAVLFVADVLAGCLYYTYKAKDNDKKAFV